MNKQLEKAKKVYTAPFVEVLEATFLANEEIGGLAAREAFREGCLRIGDVERIRNLYTIKDKYGKIGKFVPNGEQERFMAERSGHDLILKSRQIGFTTFFCIYYYDKALWEGWDTGIMSHKREHVQVIFEKVKLADEWFQRNWGEFYPREKEKSNTTELSWKDSKAKMIVAYDFQGHTIKGLHISEAAFIPEGRLTNSINAVPDDEGEVSLESTPNGRGGFFYASWKDFKEEGERSAYKGHFYPWYDHYPERRKRWDKKVPLDAEELELKENFNLNYAHLNWRRMIKKQKCGNSSETFNIQYPSDDISCFLAGENNVFTRKSLVFQETFVEEPSYAGYLKQENKLVSFYNEIDGALKIWKLPEKSGVYAIGADPSSGHGGDPCCAQVLNYSTGKQEAELSGFFDPDMFGEYLYMLGQFFNQAFICVENNNHGTAVLMRLRDLRYANLYKKYSFNSVQKNMGTEWGFGMTANSKIMVTDNLKAALRDGDVKVKSVDLLNELSTFINVMRKSQDGRMVQTNRREAQNGSHDDRVIALCLALEMIKSRPVERFGQNEELAPMEDLGYSMNPETGFYEVESDYYGGNFE